MNELICRKFMIKIIKILLNNFPKILEHHSQNLFYGNKHQQNCLFLYKNKKSINIHQILSKILFRKNYKFIWNKSINYKICKWQLKYSNHCLLSEVKLDQYLNNLKCILMQLIILGYCISKLWIVLRKCMGRIVA